MNPVLVNRWRGNAIESRHRGAVAVVDAAGSAVLSLGDVQRPIFPRSAVKFLQAIPFVESGAIERFGLDDRHIALACASHNGEPIHAGLAHDWLERLGLGHDALECGAELPLHVATRYELLGEGRGPERIHHNCSGKHVGMLSTALTRGEPHGGYRLYEHPVQRRWFEVLGDFAGVRPFELAWGYDGCGVPALALPLRRLALAMSRFGNLAALAGERRAAAARIHDALARHPYLVAGRERVDTAIMERMAPDAFVKVGAEGVFCASFPKAGLGLALKIDDGHDGAARVALGAAMDALGLLGDEDAHAFAEWFAPVTTNSRGEPVGREEPASGWREATVARKR